jgi:hypothetical protein
MNHCEVCGNEYDKLFEVKTHEGKVSHWFDSLECAISRLAPYCDHCGVRILGHGVESDRQVFCCAHCARTSGYTDAVDHTRRLVIT